MSDPQPEEKITLLYDVELHRPACVLLQAAAGYRGGLISLLFDAQDWLLSPTPDMMRVTATFQEWELIARATVVRRVGKVKSNEQN